jgi:sulfur carrier protein ThiS
MLMKNTEGLKHYCATRGWIEVGKMKIEVNLYATLSQYIPGGNKGPTHVVDVREGATVSELLQQLGVPEKSVKLIFLDGKHSDLDAVLKEENRLGVFPPVGGG